MLTVDHARNWMMLENDWMTTAMLMGQQQLQWIIMLVTAGCESDNVGLYFQGIMRIV